MGRTTHCVPEKLGEASSRSTQLDVTRDPLARYNTHRDVLRDATGFTTTQERSARRSACERGREHLNAQPNAGTMVAHYGGSSV